MNRFLRYCALLILVLAMLSMGCNKTTLSEYDEERINTIFYNMKRAFNDHDIDAFMQYVHTDYLHNGRNKWLLRQDWLDRMGEYLLLDFQNVEIEVYNDEAIVYFTLKLQNQTETVYFEEPGAHGDISYFDYDSYDWYIYGNQQYR